MAANQNFVRESNLALVAQELFRAGGGLSRADLATRTGLTRATVSRLVKDLVDRQVFIELDPELSAKQGRPATPLFPAPGSYAGIGVEINVDHVGACAYDLTGTRLADFEVTADLDNQPTEVAWHYLKAPLASLYKELLQRGVTPIGLGLTIPGIVDVGEGLVVSAPNLGWQRVSPLPEVRRILEETQVPVQRLTFPLELSNDANWQALSAVSVAPGRSPVPETFLYVSGDVGIGGAIIRGGEVQDGSNGWAGEIGHTTVEPDGPQCHCGSRGCLERYAGHRAILSAAQLPSETEIPVLVEALENGDQASIKAVERAAWALGIALANAINLIDVTDVIVGTSLSPLLPWLRPTIERELNQRLLARGSEAISLHSSSNDNRLPAARGAALNQLNQFLEQGL